MENKFNYQSTRAKAARLGHVLNNRALKIIFILIFILLLVAGFILLFYKNPLGWLAFGFAPCILMILFWTKYELAHVPAGPTDNINDLLSRDCLAHLDRNPTPKSIANLIPDTMSGGFFLVRLGLSPKLLESLAEHIDSAETIFARARLVRAKTNSDQISGGVLAIALIESCPNSQSILDRLCLESNDLCQVVIWFNSLNRRIHNSEKPRHRGGVARDFTFGFTPLLQRFAINLSRQIEHAPPIELYQADHRDAIAKMVKIFSSQGRQNVALVGDYGSGRSTILRAFAEELLNADNKISNNLKFRQIYLLDAPALISAAGSAPGKLENLVIQILNEAYAAKNIIICFDNAHLFFEQGSGSVDISNVLLPVIEGGALRTIFILDQQRYLEISAKNTALANSLNKIIIPPTNEAETLRVLQDVVPLMEREQNVVYTYSALKEAYRLSERYVYDVVMPGKAKLLLESAAAFANHNIVNDTAVQQAVEHTKGVKIQTAKTQSERFDLLNLEKKIHERMVDQESAVSTVANALRRSAAGVRNEKRPIGTFLFLGPTGVGKTELAKALSEVYFRGEDNLIRIDLNEFVEATDVARLIADGASDPLSLTAQVMKQPFSVVLLDEIEKAHPKVLTTLLQMLDEGILRDIKNREVSFRDTIVIATSNAGANEIRERIARGEQLSSFQDQFINQLINSGEFKPEFLNRFDEICLFQPLSKSDLLKILDLIIASVNKTLAPQKISVTLDDDAKQLLLEKGYDPQLGARPMRRIVQKTVENFVAKALLAGVATSGITLTITAENLLPELDI